MGIPLIKLKAGQTGAFIFEILGPNSQKRANRLAQKMCSLFADRPEIRINRPQKMGEIRIRDLVPSATAESVAQAVAEKGRCSPTEVKVGDIKPSPTPRDLPTAWAKCPLRAANKVAQEGHIAINGLFRARVEFLEVRPLQCFKCLEKGHIRAKCSNTTVDRSDLCYRCGEAGHEARVCTAQAKCAVCLDAGRPASHRMGRLACKPSKGGTKKRVG
ncbi:uncharacterized protein [Linepithema humile]|uniref:uncharacterized protein n=1 Tax=Linepithema humile TaxID=83485 RepID=UPI000623234A|nr:PREDICTED: uncharacterized protein LOC105675228 [Linepithema humile]